MSNSTRIEGRENSSLDSKSSRTLFIGGIPLDIKAKELLAYLSIFDKVKRLKLPKDSATGVLRGYAKAVMATQAGVERITLQSGHVLKGLKVGIFMWQNQSAYVSRKDQMTERKVHVTLPALISEFDLTQYFGSYQGFQEVILKNHPVTKKPRNFCYITFKSKEDALRVVNDSPHLVKHQMLNCNISRRPKQQSSDLFNERETEGYHEALKLPFASSNQKREGQLMRTRPSNLSQRDPTKVLASIPEVKNANTSVERSTSLNKERSQSSLIFVNPTSKLYFTARQGLPEFDLHRVQLGNHQIRLAVYSGN